MARVRFQPQRMLVSKQPKVEAFRLEESRVNGGVITSIDPADIPNGALQRGKNITVEFDITSRRPGTIFLDPPKPDSNAVLGTYFVKVKDGFGFTFRVTASSINSRGPGSWSLLTGPALTGTNKDRFKIVNVLDTIIFANNGINTIQKIDPNANTYAPLGNAPNYRYITGFYNRAVGAAIRDTNEVQVGWSADGVIDEWDPLVNETAGNSPILESPSDLSDYISGIFGFTNIMILLREQSIWIATKQPIPTQPFNFYAAYPGVGCNCPSTVAVIPNGLVWFDFRTKTIWAYSPGSTPEPIGRSIEKTVVKGLDDPLACFGSYNGFTSTYTLCIPRAGSTKVTTWSFHFRTQTWVEGEYDNITSINDVDVSTGVSGLTIDDLVGTIDELIGTIDSLSPSGNIELNTRAFGRGDGEILVEDVNSDTDAGVEFETLIDSKVFVIPTDDTYVMELRIEFRKKLPGSMEIYMSDDGGSTFVLWRTIPDTFLSVEKAEIVKCFGPLLARKYAWRIRATNGSFDILSYEIIASRAGVSKDPS